MVEHLQDRVALSAAKAVEVKPYLAYIELVRSSYLVIYSGAYISLLYASGPFPSVSWKAMVLILHLAARDYSPQR